MAVHARPAAPRAGGRSRRPYLRALVGAAALVAAAGAATAPGVASAAPAAPDLGPNVLVFDPSMSTAQIQAKVDAVAAQQVDNEMGSERYALLFRPGTYGSVQHPLAFQVGYYTEVAGLGASPKDVTINGSVNVYNRCLPTTDGSSNCIALDNFWRSLSNMTINVAGGTDCRTATEFWAVSQAAPMRKVNVVGNTTLMDYCTAGPQYASGGFIADSAFSGGIVNGSQQQFLTRNSTLGGAWSNGVWNQVFAGTVGAPATDFGSAGHTYTTLDKTPVSREKPYLYVDPAGAWKVFVPSVKTGSRGTSWQSGAQAGRSFALSSFYVAKPGDRIATINAALDKGKNLLFTPGVYDVDRSIKVTRKNTVVLGLGIATLTATHGSVPLRVSDVAGVDVAGLTIDAGAQNSAALMEVGSGHRDGSRPTKANPIGVQDVFFRVGGPHVGKATTSLVVKSDHTVLDDLWVWRADHGQGVGWTVNTADTGVIVSGDDVTATGLFVEHFQKYNVQWNGNGGKTVFFQNEMPYDSPDQASWSHGDVNGYAAYRVAPYVKTHEAWGLGSYIYTNVNPGLHATNAFEVPDRKGITMHDLLTVSLNKAGTIDSVINGVGGTVTPDVQGPAFVTQYPMP
ncbi:hypothetical protein CLV35_0420 [Motilibacter peucedani]|uniref:Adenylyl cyclase n=1 Tax=Motilibacter peucedani TaxID=598650 RepID=A0A420XT35_9ACTN|nr:glycoside hydrolase family 55 protein [Motilibacter peucedani]RKS80002.1 hypothetical protein CLV35_0420 [Motilibacter peucedani]